VSRFAVLDRLREQWLAAAGLALALLALVLSLLPAGGGTPRTTVLALRHALPAGQIVRERDVVAVAISASDRTPSMVGRLGELEGGRMLIGLQAGDFVGRGALHAGAPAPLLRRGERAVALRLSEGSAPDPRLLQRGRVVDVVAFGVDGAHVVARGLQLLSAAVERPGGVSVTLRAPSAVALALTAGRRGGGVLRLLLRGGGT
jgi:hypothetical protein